MAEKKKKGRRAYLNDFHERADGAYEYCGDRYAFAAGEQGFRSFRRGLLGMSLLAAALAVAGGCFPLPGLSRTAYVLLPYVVQLGGSLSGCMAAGRLAAAEYPLRGYVYESTVGRLPLRLGLALAGTAASVLGETVFLLLHGSGGHPLMAAAFYLLQTGGIASGSFALFTCKKAVWEKNAAAFPVKNTEKS